MADTVDKIINLQFNYDELIKGWNDAQKAIAQAKEQLKEFKENGNDVGAAKLTQQINALQAATRGFTKEFQNNIKAETALEGSLDQLNAKMNQLRNQYAALSREARKGAQGEAIRKQFLEMRMEVNEANEALLDFRHNVGNYASAAKGFTPLAFQVQQLAREMPSLTYSLQQFFLAISNNLPMFVDELKRAREANKALRAEGVATVPVFKQLLSSIFSWQTALVVAITLLTAFGKEIAEWVKGLFKAKDAVMSLERAQHDINKSLKGNGYGIGEQIAKFRSLQERYNALGEDMAAKKRFITENKEEFEDLGVAVNNVKDAENLLIANSETFIEALKLRAQAAAGMNLAAEKYEEALKKQLEVEEDIKKGKLYVRGGVNTPDESSAKSLGSVYGRWEYTDAEQKAMRAEVDVIRQQGDAYITLAESISAATREKLKNANISLLDEDKDPDSDSSALEEQAKRVKAYYDAIIKAQEAYAKGRDKFVREMNKEIAAYEKEFGSFNKEWEADLQRMIAQKEAEFKNRLLRAQLESGEMGVLNETIAVTQEQLAALEAQIAIKGESIELDNEQLELLLKLPAAQIALNNAKEQGADAEENSRQQTIVGVQQTIGALGQLAEAAGASAGLTAMLGIAEAVASMGAALHKAFTSSGNVWEGIAAAVTGVATIATIIAQMKQANSEAASERNKYRFADGGLVTGPGTSTSDSITAQLSNGEAVMTAQAVNDWGAVLSAMNVSSGGNAINVSNLPTRGDGMRGMEMMMERVMGRIQPVVSVQDINKGQRRVKVADNLSRLGRRAKK